MTPVTVLCIRCKARQEEEQGSGQRRKRRAGGPEEGAGRNSASKLGGMCQGENTMQRQCRRVPLQARRPARSQRLAPALCALETLAASRWTAPWSAMPRWTAARRPAPAGCLLHPPPLTTAARARCPCSKGDNGDGLTLLGNCTKSCKSGRAVQGSTALTCPARPLLPPPAWLPCTPCPAGHIQNR